MKAYLRDPVPLFGIRGKQDATFGCHVDFPVTLLAQIGLPHSRFPKGRDFFSKATPHQAFWTFNNGFGIADSTQEVVFDDNSKRVIELRDNSRTADEQRLLKAGTAQLQLLLDRYRVRSVGVPSRNGPCK